MRTRSTGPLAERLRARLQPTAGGCLEYTGARKPGGYGHIATTHTELGRMFGISDTHARSIVLRLLRQGST